MPLRRPGLADPFCCHDWQNDARRTAHGPSIRIDDVMIQHPDAPRATFFVWQCPATRFDRSARSTRSLLTTPMLLLLLQFREQVVVPTELFREIFCQK